MEKDRMEKIYKEDTMKMRRFWADFNNFNYEQNKNVSRVLLHCNRIKTCKHHLDIITNVSDHWLLVLLIDESLAMIYEYKRELRSNDKVNLIKLKWNARKERRKLQSLISSSPVETKRRRM